MLQRNKLYIQRARSILAAPHKVGIYLGKDKLSEIHSDWFNLTWRSQRQAETLQAHRGSYKTTMDIEIGMPLFHIFNPEKTILLLKESHDVATKTLLAIRKIMKSERFIALVNSLYDCDFRLTEDTDARVTTSLKRKITKEGSFECTGLKNAVTGNHYDVIVTDDIVSHIDRHSKAKRDLTDRVYLEMRNNILNPDGKMINCGTPWHAEDTFRLMPKPHRYDVYSTGIFTQEYIDSLRYGTDDEPAMLPSLYAANYELKHVASENQLFKDANYLMPDEWDSKTPLFGHIDAKYQGKDTGAFTIMGERTDGKIQAIGFIFKENIQDCIKKIISLWKEYNCGTIYKENNDDKGYTAKLLSDNGVPASSYHESENKHAKILNHLYPKWKRVYWHRDTDPEYLSQVMGYEEGQEPDDCADSAASLLRARSKAADPIPASEAKKIAARMKRNPLQSDI